MTSMPKSTNNVLTKHDALDVHVGADWLVHSIEDCSCRAWLSLHRILKNKLRNCLKVAQVDAIIRVKELCGPYEDFDCQLAIDLLDGGASSGVAVGNLPQLAKEVSDLQAPFIAENDKEDVQDFSDVDSNADSNIECLLSEDGFETEDDEALEFEPALSHLTGDDDNDLALEAALGVD